MVTRHVRRGRGRALETGEFVASLLSFNTRITLALVLDTLQRRHVHDDLVDMPS